MARFELTGKRAVITGGSSGIGLATAARFGEAGAEVVVADVQPPPDWLGLGPDAYVRTDVREEDEVAELLSEVASDGGLQMLVNNAGVGSTEPIEELSSSAITQDFGVNFQGVVWGLKHGARLIDDGGAIVNTASLGGFFSVHSEAIYCASKAAVISLTKTAALELASRRVRVNCVCPGVVDTPMVNDDPTIDDIRRTAPLFHPLGRLAQAHEIAAAIHFLASDDASFVTGHALAVDGGVLAGLSPRVTEVLDRATRTGP